VSVMGLKIALPEASQQGPCQLYKKKGRSRAPILPCQQGPRNRLCRAAGAAAPSGEGSYTQ